MNRFTASGAVAFLAIASFVATVAFVKNDAVREQDRRTVATEKEAEPAAEHLDASAKLSRTATLPFGARIGGPFDLIDHFGKPKQLEDFAGKYVLLFFGYANCEAICSAALPLMADVVDQVKAKSNAPLVPLMITVDPKNDTPAFMRKKLAEYHPDIIGMTGSDAQLADARKQFQVKVEFVTEDISGNPIYNHGSFIYLLGPDGKMKTLLPPILEPAQMAKIVQRYLDGKKT